MARNKQTTDFVVDVEGIGKFIFGKRTMRDQLLIGAQFSELSGGIETPNDWLSTVGGAIAALTVLTVEAPKDWNIDALDPLDDDSYMKLLKVHGALREKEDSFRKKNEQPEPPGREGTVTKDSLLVSAAPQPDAAGPAVSGTDNRGDGDRVLGT